jgi:hypothetical protein
MRNFKNRKSQKLKAMEKSNDWRDFLRDSLVDFSIAGLLWFRRPTIHPDNAETAGGVAQWL